MRWTGAEERTIKNWFAGTNGPSGAHLVSMFRHSDVVLDACLRLAGRERIIADRKVIETREKLKELLTLFEAMSDKAVRQTSSSHSTQHFAGNVRFWR